MSDHFDDVAQELGITREHAVRSRCPDAFSEMEHALHLVCVMVRRVSPELAVAMQDRLQALLSEAPDISTAAALALDALHPDNYQSDTD